MIVVLMGVTGSGKSTIGQALAAQLGWEYFDADTFHSVENIEKMNKGVPLSDSDRRPWLQSLRETIREKLAKDESAVLACSALRENYRQLLKINSLVRFVYLKGSYSLVKERLSSRRDHYMNPALLDSQFQTLEEPTDAFQIDIGSSPNAIVEAIRTQFNI